MIDVFCLGEILVDWVSVAPGEDLDAARNFMKAPGGAPANVAVGLARQGVASGFIGRFSGDSFGGWLRRVLEGEGVDTSCAVSDPNANTRMAYVVTTGSGDRKLADFSRVACADAQLQFQDIDLRQLEQSSILHFGSISLIADPARSATIRAVQHARQSGLLISYDPNVRLPLWESPDACRRCILETLSLSDLVKINLDELEFLTGSRDVNAAKKLRRDHSLPLLIITHDEDGAQLITDVAVKTIPGFAVKLVEATGAGDGFVAGVLAGLLPHVKNLKERRLILERLPLNVLDEILVRANAIGALTCRKAGAIPALPTTLEVDAFLSQQKSHTSS